MYAGEGNYSNFVKTTNPESIYSNTTFDPSAKPNPSLSHYYPILAAELALSIICSATLIFLYIILGEHRNLPGKNVISLSCCLIVTYVLLMVDLLLRSRIPFLPCAAIGITVQATFLATFFWTNVMSFDIMKTMSNIKPGKDKTSKYWKYSLYAWSMTLLCVIPAVALDNVGSVPSKYRPNFGVKKCWLNGKEAFLIYFNAPVGVVLFVNCLFFLLTARTIARVRSATAILQATRHRKKFRLYVKLVMIMGIVWITEFIPWITGIYWLYAVAGMLNCLHGFYMFVIFACKRRIWKQVLGTTRCPCMSTNASVSGAKKHSSSMATLTTLTSSSHSVGFKT